MTTPNGNNNGFVGHGVSLKMMGQRDIDGELRPELVRADAALSSQQKLEAYREFLNSKVEVVKWRGFDVDHASMHPSLYPHAKDIVKWGASKGRALIAAKFGLHKTAIQIEIARQVHRHTGGKFLIVCPLSVRHQFIQKDGPRLEVDWQFVTTDDEIEKASSPYLITNYESVRLGKIDPRNHDITGVSLDEGSVLRDLGSDTYQVFNDVFKQVPYRYVCTATPSPNNYIEILNYADFLEIMDRGRALTKYFQRNPNKAGDLTIHPQHKRKFWLWVSSWALFIFEPGDLGHSNEGFNTPGLRVHWHRLEADHRRAWGQVDNRGQRRLLLDPASGVQEALAEKRATLDDRVAKAIEIITEGWTDEDGVYHTADPNQHHIIWHHLEDERKAIEKAIPEAVSVYGSQKLEEREQRILGFSDGKFRLLSTKPELAGSGCNFQHYCHSNIYLGVSYQFHDFIQSLYRTDRFQQEEVVDAHILFSESEQEIVNEMMRKWRQHDELVAELRGIIQEYGLVNEALTWETQRTIGVEREEVKGKRFTAVLNDCIIEAINLPDNHFGMIATSIPFSTHYEYVDQVEDLGFNDDDNRFFEQMDFLIPELLRVLKPGRVMACHVKDLVDYGHKSRSGFMEINPFSAKTIFAFLKHGWMYEGEILVTTDVVRENNATYRLGWTETCKDSSKMGVGLPEKVLLFRKPPTLKDNAYADEPVIHRKQVYTLSKHQLDSHSYWRSSGKGFSTELYDYDEHVARLQHLEDTDNLPTDYLSEPPVSNSEWVWDDINPMFCLNSEQVRKRLEKHTCPLPFDIVKRLIGRYTSDPDLVEEPDIVYDPFAGLFTVPYIAVKMGRRGYGTELNMRDWLVGTRYCEVAEIEAMSPTMFDLNTLEIIHSHNGNGVVKEPLGEAA